MISHILPTSMRTTAGYSMLVDGLNEKIVSEREVVIATTLINSFPSTPGDSCFGVCGILEDLFWNWKAESH